MTYNKPPIPTLVVRVHDEANAVILPHDDTPRLPEDLTGQNDYWSFWDDPENAGFVEELAALTTRTNAAHTDAIRLVKQRRAFLAREARARRLRIWRGLDPYYGE